jgi:hypothetical protein
MRQITPAWARDFNNQRRHCWQGTGRRWIEGKIDQTCTEDHDPKLTGAVEWLRFIRAFGMAPFAPKDDEKSYFLLNETDGHATNDGRVAYSETYLRKNPTDWGLKPVFRVFLDNTAGWARIECYDEELVGSCELALAAVEESYKVAA